MKGLYKEKMEYLEARYRTKEGLFEWLLGSLLWGYIIVNYTDKIFGSIKEFLIFLPGGIVSYIAYLIFGLFLLPLGIILTYTLTKLYKIIFKRNGRVF